jgi:hypothetical protein
LKAKPGQHPLAAIEGTTENTAPCRHLLDNLIAAARSHCLPPLHHRRCQGAVDGDPPNIPPSHNDPTVSDPQGPQQRRHLPSLPAKSTALMMCIFRPLSLYRFFHFSTPNAACNKSMSLM